MKYTESPILKKNKSKESFNSPSRIENKYNSPQVKEFSPKEEQAYEENDFTPIHSATDNEITDETFVYFYQGNPVYIDFLNVNIHTKVGQGASQFFEKIKNDLTLRKWASLREKDKIFYLYNKIEYYNNLVHIKEVSKTKYEKMFESKNSEVNNLKNLIYDKENKLKKYGGGSSTTQDEKNKRKGKIEELEKELVELPGKVSQLDKKIQNCDQLIENYENPTDGQPLMEIISGLKEEKERLISEIDTQSKLILELDENVKQLNESVKILEMKIIPTIQG